MRIWTIEDAICCFLQHVLCTGQSLIEVKRILEKKNKKKQADEESEA